MKKLSPWGQAVKIGLIQHGWKIKDLCEATGYSPHYLYSIINEKHDSPPARKKISEALEIDVPCEDLKAV